MGTDYPAIGEPYQRNQSGFQCRNFRPARVNPAGYGFRLWPASLTFSPACFTSALVWSATPSASSRSLPTALPAASLALPLVSCTLFLALSEVLTTVPFFAKLRIGTPTAPEEAYITPIGRFCDLH